VEEDIKGIKTYYFKTGTEGRTLLFLHGWGTDHRSFLPVIEKLKDRYILYAPDLPGFGMSEEPAEIFDAHMYAEFVSEFINRLNMEKPVVIGHSNGGRIALALTRVMDIDKMILIDSAGIENKKSARYHFKVLSYKMVKRILLLFGAKGKKLFEHYRKNKGSEDYRLALDKMKAVMKKLISEDLRYLMPDIKASVLLFWGENDTATPLSDARLMNDLISDSGLVTVRNGSHYSFLDDPGLFVRVINKFLEE